MKKLILAFTALSLFSCNDDFDKNRDPDNLKLEDAPLSVQLSSGIAGIAASQGSEYAIIGGFWSQYFSQSNASSQYKSIDDYSISTNDYNGGWGTMFDALGDLKNVRRISREQGNWNYYLISTTLMVHGSQILTDFYDDIPYVESNNIEILQPRFNTGEETYSLMVADLQEALSQDLAASLGESPGIDDFIFGGNMDNWRAYANTLLLKLYMRQTEARPTVAQQGIEALLNSGAAFLDVDAAMTQFEDAPNRSNPLYETDRRQLNTQTNIRASTTTYSFLTANGDPRRGDYYGVGNPLNQGDFNNTSVSSASVSVVILSPTTPVFFLSREESLFLQAEALERYSGGTGAKALYDAAVATNFSRYNEDGSSFTAAGGEYEYPGGGSFEDKLEAIITQKWIAGFPGNGYESFFEHNRTGYPVISPVEQSDPAYVPGEWAYSVNGTTGGEFPRRLIYPNTVKTRNQNTPALSPVTEPVWWDVNN